MMNKSSLPLNPQTGDKSSIIKRVSQGEDKMKIVEEIYRPTLEEAVATAQVRKQEYGLKGIENLVSIIETNRPIKWRVEVWIAMFW